MRKEAQHSPIDVLVIGAGMHVCGRGTGTCGTVLPAVIQAHRDGLVGRMLVAATSAKSIEAFTEKLTILNRRLGCAARFEGFPRDGRDPDAWRRALAELGERSCAIIVVPDDLHAPIATEVIRRRLPVLVEKPFTPTLAEGRVLVSLARELGVYGAVDFHKRWDLMNLKLREAMEDGRIGTPLYSITEYSQRRVIPEAIFRSWVERTNPFQYLCVHFLDVLHFALRAVPRRAMGVGQYCHLWKHSIHAYDSVQACVEWEVPGSGSPFVSTFLANWIDPNSTSALSYQSLKVIGTLGRFESDQKERGLRLVTEADGIEDLNPYFTQSYPMADGSREYRGYGIDSVRAFLEDVRKLHDRECGPADLEPHRPTLRQALASTAVVDAVNQSLRTDGAWVPIQMEP
ncbi:MAG TPA: Gfo/Idh/MocA family oxidoreductase [Candidatus Methylomirabilis sp.]|nr:Gfo/Idh/MocA family oxidoreductase [Candidatus Methylomirabilis sp.]